MIAALQVAAIVTPAFIILFGLIDLVVTGKNGNEKKVIMFYANAAFIFVLTAGAVVGTIALRSVL